MARIYPFQAVRPQPEHAANVASPPYDVLSSDEARTAALHNPYSFLHVTKSEIDLPSTHPLYDAAVYEKARTNFAELIEKGILFQEAHPCYYLYELVMDGRSQTGLVCCSSVDDYEQDIIRKHEFTRPEKEQVAVKRVWYAVLQLTITNRTSSESMSSRVRKRNRIASVISRLQGHKPEMYFLLTATLPPWMSWFKRGNQPMRRYMILLHPTVLHTAFGWLMKQRR